MQKNDHSFFANRDCKYYPCHKNANPDQFNCLFCYCPLYALGDRCGGNFRYLDSGVKDCSECLLPHSGGGYDYINQKYPQIMELAKRDTE